MPGKSRRTARKGSGKGMVRNVQRSAPMELHLGPSFNFRRNWLQVKLPLITGSSGTLGAVTMGWSSMPVPLQTFLTSFDMIRVKKVRVTFAPSWNVTTVNGAVSTEIPTLVLVANYDDNVPPTTFDATSGASNARVYYQWTRPVHITVTPSFLQPLAISSSANALVVPVGAWVNPTTLFTAGVSVVSPMVKYGISPILTAPGSGNFEVWLSVDFETVMAATGGA